MPITRSLFRPAWFARGGHAQTLWAPLLRRAFPLELRRERLELPDGDFVDLDWCGEAAGRPIVVLLHGLEGSGRSPYIRGMMRALLGQGWASVVMHFRGCGGEPNRLARGYHSGDTADLAFLIERLRSEFSTRTLAAIGYSLGGNVLLKWLGETGGDNPLAAAVAVSPPFQLGRCADHIARGASRVYHDHLLWCLQRTVARKARHHGIGLPIALEPVRIARTIRQFDDRFTAPVHGFAGAEDYYTRSSCRPFLRGIVVPTLIVHAENDPFTPRDVIPHEGDLSASVTLELSDDGGHVGFVTGHRPWGPGYWLEQRVPVFLRTFGASES